MDAYTHPETLEETPPAFVSSWFYSCRAIIEEYGWYLLGFSIILIYIYNKIHPYIRKWQEQQEDKKFAALCHKNPDLVRARQEAMEAARLRLQVEHDEQARVQAEKRKEREAKKRDEYLLRQEGRGPARLGHRLAEETSSASTSKGHKETKSNYKPDYNPLMGSGGSSGYRPQRRSCPGGGCGK